MVVSLPCLGHFHPVQDCPAMSMPVFYIVYSHILKLVADMLAI